jgi:cyclopropane fatty-acyl-phospholipid synthase-like methyltransferase
MCSRRQLYEMLYDRVNQESELGWYCEKMPLLLQKAVQSLKGRGKVLDIGCGTGIYAALMAKQGLQVTGIDFVSTALEFAKIRAEKLGLNIHFVQADVTEWETHEKYDLILDSGCLHGICGPNRLRYKEQILQWMAENSNYVLVHFGKRRAFDFCLHGLAGLRPKTYQEIQAFFNPELQLKEFYAGGGKDPLFQYWFDRGMNPSR